MSITVAALYRFAALDALEDKRGALKAICDEHSIKGTLILAKEGINGTVAGSAEGIHTLLSHIRKLPGCADLDVKYSSAETMPFYRMKVHVKREIVTLGQPGVDPVKQAGTYVAPENWNVLIADPETVVIDTRNDYEVGIGTFKGAVDPKTTTFREFPDWFRANREALTAGKTKVAMFCTGGIRCEKSTAFLRAEGINEVYHLEGGILRYLETVSADQSLWEGECFVFDQRVSVKHGLEPGSYDRCHACRDPLSSEDKASPLYVEGISCPHCHDTRTDEDRARYAERQKQTELAARQGKGHVGTDPRSGD
jgi:UPF0176 protein